MAAVVSGRAASWTRTTSASAGTAARPQRTEAARLVPARHDHVGAVPGRRRTDRVGRQDQDDPGRVGPTGRNGPVEDRAAAER